MSSAYHDTQAAHDAERIANQIARAFQRAARATDRSSRNMHHGAGSGRGGPSMPIAGRARRAPGTASQFHLHAKKSKASGAGKAPVSCVNKVKYDLGLDEKDRHADRVKIAFASAPPGTPNAARDPLAMADACFERARRSRYANSHTGQMLHLDAALPNDIPPDRLARLAGDINQKISERLKVPAYSGVHLDHGNFHIHSSVPLYEIHDDGQGGFTLGDRIDHAKRPGEREALGLPRSPAGELRELRQDIANLIADAVRDVYPDDPHMAERWRHGHRTLPQQVEEAARRGDVRFVLDNLNRDATKKEGPRPQKADFAKSDPKRQAVEAHNAEVGKRSAVPGPELITRTLVHRVVDLAQKAQIDTPEGLRMLARDHGLSVHWSAAKGGEGVQGVVFSVNGGPRIAGRRLGASLGVLQKKLGWQERPKYRRFAPRKGHEHDAYLKKVQEAGIHSGDASEHAIRVTLHRLEKLQQQAQDEAAKAKPQAAPAATPVEPAPDQGAQKVQPPTKRPKRKSNDPSFNKKFPAQAAPEGRRPTDGHVAPAHLMKEPNMAIDASTAKRWMAELCVLPPDTDQPAADPTGRGKTGKTGKASVVATPICDPERLTTRQKGLLARAWDDKEARRTGAFDGPLTLARERQQRLQATLRKQIQSEPWPHEKPRRRFLRDAIMVETEDHAIWREATQTTREKIETLENKINEMINKAIADTALRAALPALEAIADRNEAQQQRAAKEKAVQLYESAIQLLSTTRPGSYQAQQALATIKQATKSDLGLKMREQQRRAEAAALERQRHGNTVHVQRERQR